MNDSYQAIYDAVRNRIGNIDIGGAVETAMREAFSMAPHYMTTVAQECSAAANEHQRPCVLFRPAIFPDGSAWCALYGKNIQEGVAGFGETPAAAAADFDRNWFNQKLPSGVKGCTDA